MTVLSPNENPMGAVPIPKLLWNNSIPLIFSLLAHSLYNFVDSVFVSYQNMLSIGVTTIRIMAVSYFLCVIGTVGSTVFQALGKGNYSMYLTLTRQVLLPLVFVFLFSLSGNLNLVWCAFILAEILSAPVTVCLLRCVQRDILNGLDGDGMNIGLRKPS